MKSFTQQYEKKYDVLSDSSEIKTVRNLNKLLREEDGFFRYFPFQFLEIEQQLEFVHYLVEEMPDREWLANLKKIDVDRNYSHFKYNPKCREHITKLTNTEQIPSTLLEIPPLIARNRLIIRSTKCSNFELLNYLQGLNQTMIQKYQEERLIIFIKELEFPNIEYMEQSINYVSDELLQFLTYSVFSVENSDKLIIQTAVTEKINQLSQKMDDLLSRKESKWKEEKESGEGNLSIEIMSACFAEYLKKRSRFLEETAVQKVLIEEVCSNPEKFQNVPQEYQVKKEIIEEQDLKSVKKSITEGVSIDNYPEKLEISRRFLEIMAKYSARNCSPSHLLDIKVYFREIFISKSSYQKKQASTIVKEYIDRVDIGEKEGKQPEIIDKMSQYIFLQEKLSRGYYREKNLTDAYVGKVQLQEKLYALLYKTYLLYDYNLSISLIYDINDEILRVLKDFYK